MILNFELVPSTAWCSNLRSVLTTAQWDVVRKDAYRKADGKCMICGATVNRLEAHETWEYDMENGVQTLVDIRAICKDCHEVIHIGRTEIIGRMEEAKEHYCKVNNCEVDLFYAEKTLAFKEWNKRSLIPNWELELSWLERNNFNFK